MRDVVTAGGSAGDRPSIPCQLRPLQPTARAVGPRDARHRADGPRLPARPRHAPTCEGRGDLHDRHRGHAQRRLRVSLDHAPAPPRGGVCYRAGQPGAQPARPEVALFAQLPRWRPAALRRGCAAGWTTPAWRREVPASRHPRRAGTPRPRRRSTTGVAWRSLPWTCAGPAPAPPARASGRTPQWQRDRLIEGFGTAVSDSADRTYGCPQVAVTRSGRRDRTGRRSPPARTEVAP